MDHTLLLISVLFVAASLYAMPHHDGIKLLYV